MQAKRIGIVGMSMGGMDEKILRGLFSCRSDGRPWVFADGGHLAESLHEVLSPHKLADAVVGRFMKIETVEVVSSCGIPMIDFAGDLNDDRLHRILVDDVAVGRLGAEFLAERGFTSLGFAPEDLTDRYIRERREGFRSRVEELGLTYAEAGGEGKWSQRMYRLVEENTPHAILAMVDRHGVMLCDLFRTAGYAVPEQVAILGVDNTELLCLSSLPPLSSIALPGEQIGRAAGDLVVRLLENPRVPRTTTLLPPVGVVERGSTDYTAVTDSLIAHTLQLIREHASAGISTGDLATELDVNRTTLARRFKRVTGRTLSDEIRRVRLELARQRLVQTRDPIYNIAVDCGFSDGEQFAKWFGRSFDTTPSQYRKAHWAQ